MATSAMNFTVDKDSNKIKVLRTFSASPSKLWTYWTASEKLDQWWAPHPWRCETKEMDFREGGKWIYSMNGPEGETHWSRVDYQTVQPLMNFTGLDSFIHEDGRKDSSLPEATWKVEFSESAANETLVSVETEFQDTSDLDKILDMGFMEGFTSALGNLEKLLAEENQE